MSKMIISPTAITPWSQQSIGFKMQALGGTMMANAASTAYPSANLAIYVPFYLLTPAIVANVFWYNGATASNNADFGIYAYDGTRLLSTGSTALSGTSALQIVDITNVQLGAGQYFMAIAMNGTAGTLFASAMGNTGLTALCGVYQQATAFALPATATFSDPTFDFIPIFGFTPRSVV